MTAARNRGLMLALAGIALLQAATLAAYRSPEPLGPGAPPEAFSAHRAKALLQELVGDGVPHPIGSPAGARMRDGIVKRLSALGYATELQSGFVCNDQGVCGSPVNIVATLGDQSKNPEAVLLAAHYDSVPAGPGASDDGASVATVLEIARILAAQPPLHPVILLLTDGEEAGMLGALLFVRQHPLSKQVEAAVNLDARGTSGPSLMFETGSANSWLMRLYGSAIARPFTNSLYYVVYQQLPNNTDFTIFKAAAYQGFNFAYIGNVGRYHTPLDTAANASARSIQHQGDNALAAVVALANSSTLRPPIAESVFFDGFSHTLLGWPTEFGLPAALASLTLLLAEALVLVRNGLVGVRDVLWGCAGTLCMLVVGTAVCAGSLALLVAFGKVPPMDGATWIAHPLPMHLAAAAIALLAASGASAWLAARAGFWGFWAAAALLYAVLAVASTLIMPGASFVFLLAAIASGLGALPFTLRRVGSGVRSRWTTDLAALLPALVIFATVLPLLRFLYTALGSLAWPLSTLVLCLGAAALLPLLAAASGRVRQRVTVTAVVIALGGWAATLILPRYSAEWPQRINLEYWFDADTGQSNYLARCDSMRLPAALAAAAHFDPVPRPRFAGSGAMAFFAAAPRLALAAPELLQTPESTALPQLTQTSQPAASLRAGAGAHFDLHLRSARGAPEALVVFPASAQVSEIALATARGPVRAKLRTLHSGATLLDIVGLPASGVTFGIDAAGPMPVRVQVFDQSYDFPGGRGLQQARPSNATSSQDGDLTVVHRSVSLDPAAGR